MIKIRTWCFFFFVLYAALFSFSCQKEPSALQNGDLIFQTSLSGQSRAIALASHSIYTHVGIIYLEKGVPYVYEAVGPVKLTPLAEWIQHGTKAHYFIKRVKNPKILSPENLKKMRVAGEKMRSLPYDLYFEWSDTKIYCSELVWKIYQRGAGIELAKLRPLKEYDLSHPHVQAMLKKRYGDKVPLDEPVVTPADLFRSEMLKTVVISPEKLL